MLRDPDRGDVELDPCEAREPEPFRMESAVAVDEKDVRPLPQTFEGGLHRWEFPEGEVRRDVRELHGALVVGNLEGLERLRVDVHGDGERSVPRVRDVDTT